MNQATQGMTDQPEGYGSGELKPGKLVIKPFGPGVIVTYAFAIGTGALVLSFYAAIIIQFLRWALG
jgi:hypothetical protein